MRMYFSVILILLLGILSGCNAIKSDSTTDLSDVEILALFNKLTDKYQDKISSQDYIEELNDFNNKYGQYWKAAGLINIEKGYAYHHQAYDEYVEKENPTSAVILFENSVSEYSSGLKAMSEAYAEENPLIYSKDSRKNDYSNYCDSRHKFLASKIESLDDNSDKAIYFIEKYRDIFNDKNCPTEVKAWSVDDSISPIYDDKLFAKRVKEAYAYIKLSTNDEEQVYINTSLAWAELSLGNYNKSLALLNKFSNKTIKNHEKTIYDSDDLVEGINTAKKLVKYAIAEQKCSNYWNSDASSKRSERIIIDIINSYNELHDMSNEGRRQTTPVYETPSYGEKYIASYNVSPLLYKVESAAERLKSKVKKVDKNKYPLFYSNMLESIEFLNKSVNYQISGYYLSKKDYRGEWEKSEAYMDESREMYSEALQSAVKKTSKTKNASCIINQWNSYIEFMSNVKL